MNVKKIVTDVSAFLATMEQNQESPEILNELRFIFDMACEHINEYYSYDDCIIELSEDYFLNVTASEFCLEWLLSYEGV